MSTFVKTAMTTFCEDLRPRNVVETCFNTVTLIEKLGIESLP